MPLSCQGLWEAEITTPAEKFCPWARYAMPGVVITPALTVSAPVSHNPAQRVSAIHELDSRVSWPMINRLGPAGKWWPRAQPIAYMVAGSSGYSPATPRIPSVPNNFRKVVLPGFRQVNVRQSSHYSGACWRFASGIEYWCDSRLIE